MNSPIKIPKFRPYLSLEEISALIVLAETFPSESPVMNRAVASLMKTKILAENGIKTASYITNPRKSLSAKLEFSCPAFDSPDFNAMMDALTSTNPTPESK